MINPTYTILLLLFFIAILKFHGKMCPVWANILVSLVPFQHSLCYKTPCRELLKSCVTEKRPCHSLTVWTFPAWIFLDITLIDLGRVYFNELGKASGLDKKVYFLRTGNGNDWKSKRKERNKINKRKARAQRIIEPTLLLTSRRSPHFMRVHSKWRFSMRGGQAFIPT